MKPPSIPIALTLIAATVMQIDVSIASAEVMEEITVYGRHNKLVLESGTATKSNMELMQTPAAIVVVDGILLRQQATSTIQDAIRNVSGLTQAGNNYGIGDNLTLRGLGAAYVVDGMYGGAGLGNSYNPTRSTTNIDSIEVLKGPATGLYGIGPAGGVINMIEKKPEFTQATEFRLGAGSWGQHGLMIDNTGPLGENTAYRVVFNTESEDGYRDLSSERDELYVSLRHNIGDAHTFTFSAAYIDDEVQIDSVGDPVRILNYDSIPSYSGGVLTFADLVNDTDADNDQILGLQLSDVQRQALAQSIGGSDGLKPLALGSGGLISPLSKPNDGKEKRIKLRYDWTINDNTTLTQQLQYREYKSKFTRQTGAYNYVYWNRRGEINAAPRAPLVINDVIYPFAARRQEYRRQFSTEEGLQYFADLKMLWSAGSFKGEHLVSINYEDRDMSVKSWSAYDADGSSAANPIPYILDIRKPNWPTGKFDDYGPSLRSNYDKGISAYGIGLQEVIYFTESLTGRVGFAYNTIKQDYQHKGTDRNPLATLETDTDDSGNTFNVGLNYRLTPEFAMFANYAKGRTAYSILGAVNGATDRPDSESESVDLGIRFTGFEENLLGSIVVFDTARTNLRYNNVLYNDNPADSDFNVDVSQYFYDDEDKTEGVEFDLNFRLLSNWAMNANYTYQKTEITRKGVGQGQSKGVPRNFARVWTDIGLEFDALSSPLQLRLGIRYEDERTIESTSFGLPGAFLPSYTVWDAGISYAVAQWSAQLNIDNLTDETYYSKAMFLGGLPGEERNLRLTVRYDL